MTHESLSLVANETEKEKSTEERVSSGGQNDFPSRLSALPDVVLHHLAPFLIWTSRRSLSQMNSRLRSHYAPLLKDAGSLSIKGNVPVGFYIVQVEMGEDMHVGWTIELESRVRTVVHRMENGKTTSKSVPIPSSEYLEKIMTWLLDRYRFTKIHLGVSGLSRLFQRYIDKVDDLGVSDEVEYLELAQRFKPRKLTLFQPTHNNLRRGVLDLKKFPQLEELVLLLKVTADTINEKIRLRHAHQLIENWKNGVINYKKIVISSETARIPVRVPHQQWAILHDEHEETDSFCDDVVNRHQKMGSFRYSPNCFEFISWDENGGMEPSQW
ncbi:unnamed protein product [Caenorhabditis sp. 36 PRJEB53466]|nr:unnamed protein product [Caenorhabditis sp. 36 PRJEB53466]